MTGPDAETTAAMELDDQPQEDLDAWREGVAFLTPSGAREWLALPILFFVLGAGFCTFVFVAAHGRTINPLGWVLVSAAFVFVVWSIPLAWFGWRACVAYDLERSQRYVRQRLASGLYLCVLASAAGAISGWSFLATIAGATVIVIRSRYPNPTAGENPTDFRRSLVAIVQRAFLVEGLVLTITTLTCGLVGAFVLPVNSHLSSEYLGGGVVLFLVGAVSVVMAIQQRSRRAGLADDFAPEPAPETRSFRLTRRS